MASRAEQIILAVIAKVDSSDSIKLRDASTITKPNNATVDRNRRQPIERGHLPRISVYLDDEAVSQATRSRVAEVSLRERSIRVRSRVEGTDAGLDPFRIWVVASLLIPPAKEWYLRGLALSIEELSESIVLDEDAQTNYSAMDQIFRVRYATSKYDVTAEA